MNGTQMKSAQNDAATANGAGRPRQFSAAFCAPFFCVPLFCVLLLLGTFPAEGRA
jgi:hypothetical protein